jgi:hypothetical protein
MRDEKIRYQLTIEDGTFYHHLSFFTCKSRDECNEGKIPNRATMEKVFSMRNDTIIIKWPLKLTPLAFIKRRKDRYR